MLLDQGLGITCVEYTFPDSLVVYFCKVFVIFMNSHASENV